MNLRDGVKQLLRMCGHAFVGTVHDRLNDVDRQLSQIASQQGDLKAAADSLAGQQGDLKAAVDSLAEADGALLQSGIRTIEGLKDVQAEFRRLDAEARQRLDEIEARWSKLLGAVAQLEGNFSQSQDHLRRALEKQTEVVTRVQSQLADTSALFENELVRQVCVESDDYEAVNLETGLLTFLYSYLPTRKALDIGAHVGDVSDRLLKAGYEVYAFEPAPGVFEKLRQKLEGRKGFTAFQLALGSSEGEALLHLATDLSEAKYYEDPTLLSSLITHSMPREIPFTHTVPVLVKTISELHRSGLVPEDIALVKIDTEGFDLEVIRGMGDHRYPVVAAEYFDVRHPFGQSGLYTLETLIGEMRNRGYLWHIVMHRDWHCKHTAYYCNHERAVPGTWGNAIFFRDYGIFSHAQSWCSAVLPRTYFKAVARA
jgi:FkbM family methyltransferase